MDIFWYPWPDQLYCDSFPDEDDPNICIGYKEAREIPEIEGETRFIKVLGLCWNCKRRVPGFTKGMLCWIDLMRKPRAIFEFLNIIKERNINLGHN